MENWFFAQIWKGMENDRVWSEKGNRFQGLRGIPAKSFGGYAKDISKRRFISSIAPTVRTNPSRKRGFSKILFDSEEFDNAGFSF